ncbi:MAG: hypothetical protein ACOCRX_08295 [Candidatus Woesearchaeota archaeon]
MSKKKLVKNINKNFKKGIDKGFITEKNLQDINSFIGLYLLTDTVVKNLPKIGGIK